MSFDSHYASSNLVVSGPELLSGDWVVESLPTITTDPNNTDKGKVTLIKMVPPGTSLPAATSDLLGACYAPTGLYIVGVNPAYITLNLVRAECTLEGVCSPKTVKRTLNGNRKELAGKNETWTKKYQAENPAFQDVFLTGPGLSVAALPNPPTPNHYGYSAPAIIINEPYGWVKLGEDEETIPFTPYARRTVKVQWFWQYEPDF